MTTLYACLGQVLFSFFLCFFFTRTASLFIICFLNPHLIVFCVFFIVFFSFLSFIFLLFYFFTRFFFSSGGGVVGHVHMFTFSVSGLPDQIWCFVLFFFIVCTGRICRTLLLIVIPFFSPSFASEVACLRAVDATVRF